MATKLSRRQVEKERAKLLKGIELECLSLLLVIIHLYRPSLSS